MTGASWRTPGPGLSRCNPHFLKLCGPYSVQSIACRVGEPPGKGKIENTFCYLENHLIKGSHWHDFAHLCEELTWFDAEDIDLQVHTTTREQPIHWLQREAPHLVLLPTGRLTNRW
jgi:hypothetical protein